MAMAAVYSHRYQAPVTPAITVLREELYPEGFTNVDFVATRSSLRDADLYKRPTAGLRAAYVLARLFERFHGRRQRARCVETIVKHIRWELQATTHASISPLNGLFNVLALWLRDPTDADLRTALAQLDRWVWEDEDRGTRVTLQRSASWDTAFALQALATAPGLGGVRKALRNGAEFLRRQRIDGFEHHREAYRNDPAGGWCFAGGWHGWPVSDRAAEAVLGLIAVHGEAADPTVLRDAVRFMLGAQNRDGGFGSYEDRRSVVPLEWLNPSEMFADAMNEPTYVECTASCIAALAVCTRRFPQVAGAQVATAVSRAAAWLHRTQASDGSWRVWDIPFIYGTFFGIRGLVAGGARPGVPALRRACQWLLDRQQSDGGWGERHRGCLTGRYVPRQGSQVIQTAWALIALLEADKRN